MKHYFTRITQDHWSPKNNAHKEAQKLALLMERKVFPEKELQDYLDTFMKLVGYINDKERKCKDLDLIIWKFPLDQEEKGDRYILTISQVFQLEIIEVAEMSKHYSKLPDSINESLNSGDGTYRP